MSSRLVPFLDNRARPLSPLPPVSAERGAAAGGSLQGQGVSRCALSLFHHPLILRLIFHVGAGGDSSSASSVTAEVAPAYRRD